MAPWTSAAWARLFDQQFHPAVARQRQLRAWATAPDRPPVLLHDGHGRARPRTRRWPEDFGAISVDEFVAHATYVRDKDTEELGRTLLLAVHRHLARRWVGGPPHDPRIAVRTVTGGPRPYALAGGVSWWTNAGTKSDLRGRPPGPTCPRALIGQDGVFALDAVPRHTVLCEYAGVVRTQKLVRARKPGRRRRATVEG